MGGYLGTVEEWERVSEAWDACLSTPPGIGYFKSDEAKNLQGEFLHFNHATADQKKCDLAAIVGSSNLQGFCASVPHVMLAHRDPSATKQTAGSRTYDWGFFTSTSGVLQYARDHYPDEATVDFVFDERRELAQCVSLLNELKELAQEYAPWTNAFSRAGTCTPGDDKKVVPLQMGDLLAGEFSSMGNAENPPSEAWKRLSVRGIVHIPCDMPRPIPILIALQGMGKQIKDSSGKILKRIYKDKERTSELAADCDDLIARQALFEAAMNTLIKMHESDEGFRRFQEIMRSKNELE